MNFTEFFIKHKVVAIIFNAMILIVGALALKNIVVREYPDIKLPIVSIMTSYPNASSELVESSVTNLLEDELASVSKIKSISSESSFGMSSIMVNFEEGTIVDDIIIDVREAIGKAKSRMPHEVLEPNIYKGGRFGGVPFFAISVSSDEVEFQEITHYARRFIKNSLRSVGGVSTVEVWGRPYSMLVTIDPQKIYNYGLNFSDAADAIKKHNIFLPTGNYQNKIPSNLDLRLQTEEEFESTLIAKKNNKAIYLKDIANIKLGVDPKANRTKVNGKPGILISVERNNDANPLEVANNLEKHVEKLKQNIPKNMQMNIEINQSVFIESSIGNIKSSIIEAVILVLIIVYIFLGSLSSTLIPLVTVPISLMGSIAILMFAGMSLNVFTLLAMVLAIGLVVDDAIIVLENITRHIEKGLGPLEASIKGAKEIGFAIIAMTSTLASVYAPIAFVKGISGQMFMEFAVTLAGSVIISGIIALTLSPMMCAHLIGKHKDNKFQRFLRNLELKYYALLGHTFNKNNLIIGIILASFVLSYVALKVTPGELLPQEDRSLMGVYVPPQSGKSLDEMEQLAEKVSSIIKPIPEKENYLTFIGNWGMSIVVPLPKHEKRSRSQEEIRQSIEPIAKSFPSVDVWPWGYDSGIVSIGSAKDASNATFALLSTGSYKDLADTANKLLRELNSTGKFIWINHDAKFDEQQFDIVINKPKFSELNINSKIFSEALKIAFSGNNDLKFIKDDIEYPITIESAIKPWSLSEIYINAPNGKMISSSAFAAIKPKAAMASLNHYNQVRVANFTAMPMPPNNIDSSIEIIEKIAKNTLPASYSVSWTGSAQMQKEASNAMSLLFITAIIFIYAILAVQFNSFSDPIIIMFTVPLACFGALVTNYLLGFSINTYTQIGLITLVGLITKHGILIVEFANSLRKEGRNLKSSIIASATQRLRPILMTSAAMILGSIPLLISSGAGSEARHAIGIILVAGLGFGTVFTLFILPKIYFWVKGFATQS